MLCAQVLKECFWTIRIVWFMSCRIGSSNSYLFLQLFP